MQQKHVVISGAGEGIGWAMAQRFAQAGYRVLISDIDAAKAQARAHELGAGHLGAGGDVTSEADTQRLAALCKDWGGGVQALVNNAGIPDHHAPTLEQDMSHYSRVLDVHLKGTFLMSRAFGAMMMEAGAGAIVNIGSIAGNNGMPRRNAYGAAKAGVVAMTRAMACEWAEHGIRVNAIIPGYVETALVKGLITGGKLDDARLRRRIPMGRLGQPDDIAKAAVFLCSDDASYITGSQLSVDGGWAAFGDSGDASR